MKKELRAHLLKIIQEIWIVAKKTGYFHKREGYYDALAGIHRVSCSPFGDYELYLGWMSGPGSGT